MSSANDETCRKPPRTPGSRTDELRPDTAVGRYDRPLRWAGLAISAVSLAGVVWWALGQEAPRFPDSLAGWSWLGAAILVYLAGTLLRGERWFCLLRNANAETLRGDSYRLTFVGYMGNNVLPARGGDALRIVLQTPRSKASARTVTGTLVAERLLDAVFLLSLFAFLAYVVLEGIDAPDLKGVTITVAAVASVTLVAGSILWLKRSSPLAGRIIRFVTPITVPVRELRGEHGLYMVVLTVVIWALEATTYAFATRSLNVEISAVEAAYLVALASLFVLIPSGPGYVGTLDAAFLFGLNAIDVTGSAAVSCLIMLRFVLLVPVTLIGLVILLTYYRSPLSVAKGEG